MIDLIFNQMKTKTKIFLAAGVFYPDVGGPAIHVRKIAERLVAEGFEVTVLAYGNDKENKDFGFKIKRISRQYHKALQWVLYFLFALRFSFSASLVYAFDPTAAGLPSYIAAKMFRKPFLIRIGGDPIWEREAEMGRRVMPLTTYYEKGLYKEDKPFLFKIIKNLLNSADRVIFYNQFWKDFAYKYYKLPASKVSIVKNPIFRRENASPILASDPTIIFAGRFVIYKNLPLVIQAFDKVWNKIGKGRLLLIGKGPEEKSLKDLKETLVSKGQITFLESLPQEQLFERIKESSVAIGPALSEFNPNFILESLSFGKPVILSKGHGLSIDLPDEFLFDPLNQDELEKRIEYLFDPINYQKAIEIVNNLDMSQTWEKVTDFHLNLIKEIIKS